MYSTLAGLVLVGALVWLWRDSLRAREAAARLSRRACDSEGVQFLDDTVSIASVRPVLVRGRPALRRTYQFEFSRRGDDRWSGSVTLTGDAIDSVFLTPQPGTAPPPAAVIRIEDARRLH